MTAAVELIESSRRACCTEVLRARLSAEVAQQFCDELQILAHPIRIQILDILSRSAGQVCVCDLEAALPIKQPTVSHHLRLLRQAGLIDCERQGLWAYYFLKADALQRYAPVLPGNLMRSATFLFNIYIDRVQ